MSYLEHGRSKGRVLEDVEKVFIARFDAVIDPEHSDS